MPREYRKAVRARGVEETRGRVLDAARESLRQQRRIGMREIAGAAGVTVQTLYSHFGSKGGLVMALVDEVAREHGLWRRLEENKAQPDALVALEDQVALTFEFWHRAWPFIGAMLEARRNDPDFEAQIRRLDESRLEDLKGICARLGRQKMLRPGLSGAAAASLAYAITTPYVYEELVAKGRAPYAAAARRLRQAVLAALLT